MWSSSSKVCVCFHQLFLAKLGRQRAWKTECAVCLEEHIGKTCTCNHTSTVMFRPCGHTVCASPCFAQWMKTKGQELSKKTVLGMTYNSPMVDLQPENLECLVCRERVLSTFEAERVMFPPMLFNCVRGVYACGVFEKY